MQCCQVDWSENSQILSQKEQKRRKELLCSAIVWFLQSMPTQKSPEELKNSKFATRFGNTAFSSSFLLLFSDHNKISNKAPFLLHTRYRPLLPSQRGVAYIVVALCPYAEAKRELGRSKKRRKALYFLVPNQTYFFLIHCNFCGSKEIIPQIHKQCNCKLLWIFFQIFNLNDYHKNLAGLPPLARRRSDRYMIGNAARWNTPSFGPKITNHT